MSNIINTCGSNTTNICEVKDTVPLQLSIKPLRKAYLRTWSSEKMAKCLYSRQHVCPKEVESGKKLKCI